VGSSRHGGGDRHRTGPSLGGLPRHVEWLDDLVKRNAVVAKIHIASLTVSRQAERLVVI